jgi:hypothetical protein
MERNCAAKLRGTCFSNGGDLARGHRNPAHSGYDVPTRLVFGKEEAKITLEVVNLIHRQLP